MIRKKNRLIKPNIGTGNKQQKKKHVFDINVLKSNSMVIKLPTKEYIKHVTL